MENIKILIDEKKLQKRIRELAKQIENDYKDKTIHLICILKGSLFFTCDLAKYINKNVRIDFIRISSYKNNESGEINLLKGLLPTIDKEDIILVEDIIDSGKTMNVLVPYLKELKPNSIKVCTLLDKPSRRKYSFNADYIGFEIEDKFVLGYGLDYNQDYRNLPFIGYIEER